MFQYKNEIDSHLFQNIVETNTRKKYRRKRQMGRLKYINFVV